MIEFWNVVVASICAFVLGMTVHSAWRHSFNGIMKRNIGKGVRRILSSLLGFELWLLGEHIPEHWVRVDYTFVAEKLIEAFPFAEKIYLSDRYFYLCPKRDVIDFLAQDPTDKERYVTEVFDCDDFSFRLMGQFHTKPYSALAFGVTWSEAHAYNAVVIDNEHNVWIVEPQTDALIRPEDAEKGYETRLIWM